MSITLNPEPFIYAPPLTLFGGVKVSIESSMNLINDLSKMIKRVTDSIYQAYEVKTKINAGGYSIETITKPLIAEIDNSCKDYISTKSLDTLILKLKSKNKEQGIFVDESINEYNQFYFVQLLSNKFDPELSKNLLIAIQEAALTLTKRKHVVKGLVTNYCLTTLSQLM